MGRPFWSCLAATIVAVAAALPSSAVADDHARRHYNSGDDERDNLGWVIVSGGITSVSDMSDLESLEGMSLAQVTEWTSNAVTATITTSSGTKK